MNLWEISDDVFRDAVSNVQNQVSTTKQSFWKPQATLNLFQLQSFVNYSPQVNITHIYEAVFTYSIYCYTIYFRVLYVV